MKFSHLAAALAVLLSGIAARADEIRLATQPMPHYAPIFVAKEKGWLNEELAKVKPGIEVKWSSFPAGPPINESFAAGQQDFGFLGDTPALIGKSVGIDTRLIAKTSQGQQTLAVVVGADSSIKSPKELKGKKVAVTKGSYAHHLLALVLQQGGLGLGDIELVNLPNAEIPPAIIAGTIDAGAVWEPVITRFEAQKAIRVLADGTGIKAGLLVIIATNDIVKSHPDQVKALLRAYARGADYVKAHPKEAAELIASDVNLSPDLLVQVFAKLDFNPVLHDVDIAEVQKTADFQLANGLIKQRVDVAGWAEPEISKAAELK